MGRGVKVPVGSSEVNASDLRGLQRAWRSRRLVLFLGAGVSFDYGIPGWYDLVLALLFRQAGSAARLKRYLPHYRRALTDWLVDTFDYDPVVLARVIRNDIRRRSRRAGGDPAAAQQRFLDMVRQQLYAGMRRPKGPTTLAAVADLVEATNETSGLAAVVTFNFDDLLERELVRRAGRLTVDPQPVWEARRIADGVFPILHPHGFLPRGDAAGSTEIVFTEEDYHQLTRTVFHWALTEIVAYLRHYHVVFVGLSMSDPNLRRLVDASYVGGDIPCHWQVQRSHRIPDSALEQAVDEIQRRAQSYRRELDETFVKGQFEVGKALRATLRQADTYDRELFESMGVKTIWLSEYADLPPLLAAIKGTRP